MEKDKHLGLRIDSETHAKLKSLAEFDGRSINGEVLYLIRQAIAQHEKDHVFTYTRCRTTVTSIPLIICFFLPCFPVGEKLIYLAKC